MTLRTMGIMVYSLLWVMQEFVHQQYYALWTLVEVEPKLGPIWLEFRLKKAYGFYLNLKEPPF